MSLSFREQAVTSIVSAQAVEAADRSVDPQQFLKDAVENADAIAQACCARWGHVGAKVISLRDRIVSACERCGYKPEVPE